MTNRFLFCVLIFELVLASCQGIKKTPAGLTYDAYYVEAKELIKLSDRHNVDKLVRIHDFKGLKDEGELIEDIVWIDSTFRKDTVEKISYNVGLSVTPFPGYDTIRQVAVSFTQYSNINKFDDKLTVLFPLGHPDLRKADFITVKSSSTKRIQEELQKIKPPTKN